MYVDKMLTGLNAIQILSRLNRWHPGKIDTFVLDFRNTADEITKAFAPFYEHAYAAPTDPNLMFDAYRELWSDFDVLREDEVDAFAEALVADNETTHERTEAALAPAVDRFGDLSEKTRSSSGKS